MLALTLRSWGFCILTALADLADLADLAVDFCHGHGRLALLRVDIVYVWAFPSSFFGRFPSSNTVGDVAAEGSDGDKC
jgi:hypothetical protein